MFSFATANPKQLSSSKSYILSLHPKVKPYSTGKNLLDNLYFTDLYSRASRDVLRQNSDFTIVWLKPSSSSYF